jgi:4-hydroxyphenylpyruvate dioxygenase
MTDSGRTSTAAAAPATTATAALSTPADLLLGWDHLELWVGNARSFAYFLEHAFGFELAGYAGPETGVADRASYLLQQGAVRLVVTAGLAPDSPVVQYVGEHGDGVRTIGFEVGDVDAVLDAVVARGAPPADPAGGHSDAAGELRTAATATYGQTQHVFVDRSRYRGFAPGFTSAGPLRETAGCAVGLAAIDHVVGNVELGRLDEWVEWYERVFGFAQMRHFAAEAISTEFSALRSTVMWNGQQIVLPLNEPAEGRRKSQIQEYLDANRGPGVQHVALATVDIIGAVDELRRRGVRFLTPPATYYEDARDRCGHLSVPWSEIERL